MRPKISYPKSKPPQETFHSLRGLAFHIYNGNFDPRYACFAGSIHRNQLVLVAPHFEFLHGGKLAKAFAASILLPASCQIARQTKSAADACRPFVSFAHRMKWVPIHSSFSGRPYFSLPRAMLFIRNVMFRANVRMIWSPSASFSASPGTRP